MPGRRPRRRWARGETEGCVRCPAPSLNIRDGHDLDEDDEVARAADVEVARAEACVTVEELRGELRDAGNIELEITDETGRRVLTVAKPPRQRGGRRG